MTLNKRNLITLLLMLGATLSVYSQNPRANGYKGIWYTINQGSEYGHKYSGGLGTYTANHLPVAIYSPEADKTFFVYGGTTDKNERHLLIMISYYDHKTGMMPRPVIVCDKEGVDDPHDNASITIDKDGYIWVFVSGRNVTRMGQIFKATAPHSIDSFEKVHSTIMTYPQPWYIKDKGFVHLFTKYTAPGTKGRELYWSVSTDGKTWTDDRKLAGMGGHYQLSNRYGNKIVTIFNYHPDGGADTRTNIYLAQTEDMGHTWQTVDGKQLSVPLTDPHGKSLVYDYEAEGKLVYLNDLNFDKDGNPIILAITSYHYQPGPKGNPREWIVFHWKDGKWKRHKVCQSSHNYDMGSLYVDGDTWTIIGPTENGPQKYGTGGEMACWKSPDEGATWTKVCDITHDSPRNHSYARRPLYAKDDFYAFWADGHADTFSQSKLYFTNSTGDTVWEMPYTMEKDSAYPTLVDNIRPANWIDAALAHAERQALLMADELKDIPAQLPRSVNSSGKLVTSGSDWWCSGFYPGVLWMLYENSRNPELARYASEFTSRINKEQYNTSTHDLGFMLYCSYGNALRITQADSCRTLLLNGARSLASRYNPVVGCIQSWGAGGRWRYPVIIDNMMNLEMLMWAYKESGNKDFRDISVSHANKTMKNHFRRDNSSYHVLSYNPGNGKAEFKGTDQGYSDESAWARGQAWGLYGYTMMFRETGDSRYLKQAHKIARFIINHPNLPGDKIPYWDFDSPDIPNTWRDSSSAAIIASALLELSTYSDEALAKEYFRIAEKQLQVLSSPEYTAETGKNGNFILKHGVGNIPQNSEIDAPLTYGDYYYIEALLRYKNYQHPPK